MKHPFYIIFICFLVSKSFPAEGIGGYDSPSQTAVLRPVAIASCFIAGTLLATYFCRHDSSQINKNLSFGINGGVTLNPWIDSWGTGFNLNIDIMKRITSNIFISGVLGYTNFKEKFSGVGNTVIPPAILDTLTPGYANIISVETPMTLSFHLFTDNFTIDTKFGPGLFMAIKNPNLSIDKGYTLREGTFISAGFNFENTFYYSITKRVLLGIGHNLQIMSDEFRTWSFYLELNYRP